MEAEQTVIFKAVHRSLLWEEKKGDVKQKEENKRTMEGNGEQARKTVVHTCMVNNASVAQSQEHECWNYHPKVQNKGGI